MDDFDHPDHRMENEIGLSTVLAFFALALSLFVCLLSFSEAAQLGPDVGEIVLFDPQNGPRYWSEPGIPAPITPTSDQAEAVPPRNCILMPSIMAAGGGSLVIEAKITSQPPLFRVHWSGQRTDAGARDCGRSADLTLQLVQLRALVNIAGGYGINHRLGVF